MKRSIYIILALTLTLSFFLYIPLIAQQEEEEGKISEFEKATQPKEDNTEESQSYAKKSHRSDSSFFGELVAEIIFKPMFIWTFIGPPGDESLLDFESFWSHQYAPYPYAVGNVGLYAKGARKSYSITLWGDYFFDADNLNGFGIRGRLAPLPFLSVDLKLAEITESLNSSVDQLQFYDIILNYSRIRTGSLSLWWGLGLKGIYISNNNLGPLFNLGTEIYPFKPLSLHVNYNISSINTTAVGDLLIHLNYHFNRYLAYFGYQRLSAGSTVLDGVVAGFGVHY